MGNPQFPSTPRAGGAILEDGTLTTLLTAGSNGTYCEKICYFCEEEETVTLNIFISDGTSDYQLYNETLAITGTIILDFALPANYSIKAQLSNTPTGTVTVVCFGGDY